MRSHAAVKDRLAARVEHIGFDPGIIGPEPDGPEHGRNSRLRQINLGAFLCGLPDFFEGRFDRGIDAFPLDMGVDLIADADVGAVGVIKVFGEVRQELDRCTVHVRKGAIKFHTVIDMELAQVDLLAAIAPGHVVIGLGQRLVRVRVLGNGEVVMPRVLKPVGRITAPVFAGAARRRADRQMDVAARTGEILH